jgi:hypothetical protein
MKNSDSNYADAVVTIRVKNLGSWGDECTAGQIRDQAARTAIRKIQSVLHDQDFEIIGNPNVTLITARLNEEA